MVACVSKGFTGKFDYLCAYGYGSGGEGDLGGDQCGSSGAKTVVGGLESWRAYPDRYTCSISSSIPPSEMSKRVQPTGSEILSKLPAVSSAAVVWPTTDVVT